MKQFCRGLHKPLSPWRSTLAKATDRTLMPRAQQRRSSRRLRVAKGMAGRATRQVSSKNTRPPPSGMAYRKDGTSSAVPHSPSPPCWLSPGCCLQGNTRAGTGEDVRGEWTEAS